MCANKKSANARSGLMLSNWLLFCGFTCNRRQTPRMKLPTQEMNPDKNALNGNVPTKQQ